MFLQIVKLDSPTTSFMPSPHSHDYYELYFQLEGNNRQLFIGNKMYLLPSEVFCVIPPFFLHKMDGNSHKRININISKDLLSQNELDFLDSCAKNIAIQYDKPFFNFITRLLDEAAKIYTSNNEIDKQYEISLVKTIIYFLKTEKFSIISPMSITQKEGTTDPIILKLVLFISNNYQSHIDLKMLCEQSFLSKATLCARFKKMMNCSVMDYLVRLRLGKAKELLLSTNYSIDQISIICGFSSTNYFRTTFKQINGITPLHYRKEIRGI